MSYPERIACLGGGILLALTATVIFREKSVGNARRRAGEPPAEELAEKLKEAWSEHHTTA